MARLNEPAPAPETMESLKRKFMRQNRDIARANSTQSLRIRNLENETSRLLAENLGLREQIIRLQRELDEGKAQRIADHAINLRSQLEVKLQELGSLISGLGSDAPPKMPSPKSGKITRASLSKSPDQRNWKNMCTLSEAVNGQDGRLPPILENKTYPRRTLERQEIVNLIADAELDNTDSPEIGPPPVSQFVDEDPVKIDLPRRVKDGSKEPLGLDPALSINLEQRRKRKSTNIFVEPEQTSTTSSEEPSSASRETEQPLKTGAKRKLSVREDEEDVRPMVPPSPDNFKFTRIKEDDKSKGKTSTHQERSGNKAGREIAVPRGPSREKHSSAAISSRRALAIKSVNDSPRKMSSFDDGKDNKPRKLHISKAKEVKEIPKEGSQEEVSIEPDTNPILHTVEMEPETPAGVDIFSPSSSQPSTVRVESRDTPPPGDIGISAEGHRPSRRARGAVSYAEPNLRDKMRRPTKDLVDAVSKEETAQRAALKLEEEAGPRITTIKSELEEEDAWKNMPAASVMTGENSPLSNKAPELLPSITTHRKRRESFLTQMDLESPSSLSGNAVAALLAERKLARHATRERLPANGSELAKSLENLDISDTKVFQSVQVSDIEADVKEKKPALRISRRHPSTPDLPVPSDNEPSDMEAPKKNDVSGSRRRQSTLGLRNSSTNPELAKKTDSQRSLTRSISSASMTEAGQNGNRSDRISSRRRSMML